MVAAVLGGILPSPTRSAPAPASQPASQRGHTACCGPPPGHSPKPCMPSLPSPSLPCPAVLCLPVVMRSRSTRMPLRPGEAARSRIMAVPTLTLRVLGGVTTATRSRGSSQGLPQGRGARRGRASRVGAGAGGGAWGQEQRTTHQAERAAAARRGKRAGRQAGRRMPAARHKRTCSACRTWGGAASPPVPAEGRRGRWRAASGPRGRPPHAATA